jgi:hypothetical protein
MSMAKKKKPRFPSKLAADAYRFLLEELNDKRDYELGGRMYCNVYVTFYDCYISVHCILYHDDKAEDIVQFARNGNNDYHNVTTKLFGNRKKYD